MSLASDKPFSRSVHRKTYTTFHYIHYMKFKAKLGRKVEGSSSRKQVGNFEGSTLYRSLLFLQRVLVAMALLPAARPFEPAIATLESQWKIDP